MDIKHGLLIYTDKFLQKTMTFVYNQLIQAEKRFRVFAGCTKRLNADLFPFERVIIFPEKHNLFYYIQGALRRSGLLYIYRNKQFEIELSSFIKNNHISIIHAHFGLYGIRLFRLASECKIPLLITFHGFDASRYLQNTGYVRELKKIMDSPLVYGITVSEYMKNVLNEKGINVSRTICNYIFIDTNYFIKEINSTSKHSDSFVFLQVSGFVEKKGHEYTVRAFNNFLNRVEITHRKPILILGGEGPFKKHIEKLVTILGIEDYVKFPGFCNKSKVRQLMADADVFVHHSVTPSSGDKEGIPTVIMEAMAMELPVLSTWHAGIPELIQDGINGYLVEERDIDSYSDKLIKLYCSETLDYSHNRNVILEKFDLEKNAKILCDHYENIIKEHPIK